MAFIPDPRCFPATLRSSERIRARSRRRWMSSKRIHFIHLTVGLDSPYTPPFRDVCPALRNDSSRLWPFLLHDRSPQKTKLSTAVWPPRLSLRLELPHVNYLQTSCLVRTLLLLLNFILAEALLIFILCLFLFGASISRKFDPLRILLEKNGFKNLLILWIPFVEKF